MSVQAERTFLQLTIKAGVGLIALSLAAITNWLASSPLRSISASYYQTGGSKYFFVCSLLAIAAFLFFSNGSSRRERVASKVAALAALGVALVPCECASGLESTSSNYSRLHYLSAAAMFLVLTYFCYCFRRDAKKDDRYNEATLRGHVYTVCGVLITLAIVILFIDDMTNQPIGRHYPRLTFHLERAALAAFGVSWLAASGAFPLVMHLRAKARFKRGVELEEERKRRRAEFMALPGPAKESQRNQAWHLEIAGAMVKLQHGVESGVLLLALALMALLVSGIVRDALRGF